MRHPGQVAIRIENAIPVLRGAGDHPAVGVDDIGLAGKIVDLFLAYAVSQGRIIPVLESGDLEFSLENALGPLAYCSRLGDDDDLRSLEGQLAHVFRKMAVVADGHADVPGPGFADERTPVSGPGLKISQAAARVSARPWPGNSGWPETEGGI